MLSRGGRTALSLRRALIILPVWIACIFWMWSWWIFSDQPRYLPLFIPLTLAMMYEFGVLPSMFLYFVIKAKAPKRKIAKKGHKVAVISLCVPSKESLDIVESQLQAMTQITYPHDSWILDEGGSAEVKRLAKRYGVKYFSRRGERKYNQAKPPFQKKTKAGNVNAWLEHVKTMGYDYFVQFDIDHIAKPNYLNKTLGYFKDPGVAWVQAPSVYKNTEHWTARGAAEQELVLQGPLQMGFYGHSSTPFIIGSHCTYRMSAIREIGGFQPTRAEDHLDTLQLAGKGYSGVFLPEIIAEGDGPETLSTYLAQQFAWAYSMFQVLLWHTPHVFKAMSGKRRWQFLFAQTWYPFWSLSYLMLFVSPIIALWANKNVMSTNQQDMAIHFLPMFISTFLIWWTGRPLMQPRNIMLSWRGILLHAVRWPIILRAIFAAAFKIKKPYMITPKGSFAHLAPTLKTYRPFLLFGTLSSATVVMVSLLGRADTPEAQIIFSLANAGFMFTICAIDLGLRARQVRPNWHIIKEYWLKPMAATGGLALLLITASIISLTPLREISAHAETSPLAGSSSGRRAVRFDMSTQELIEQIRLVPAASLPKSGIGMYSSRDISSAQSKVPHIQHSFADWRDDHYIAFRMAESLQAGNTPLVTIEPDGEHDGAKLLEEIAAGEYDARFQKIANITNQSKNTIYIRFAHEMELADLYPWGNQPPQLYIAAYQHASQILKGSGANVEMVWSPAGNPGAEAYYPGDESVDIIGTTVLYDEYWYGDDKPSFADISETRTWLHKYGKPIWAVEFGAGNADHSFQKQLITDALEHYRQLGYDALLYIDMKDANIQEPDYSLFDINDFGQLFMQPGNRQVQKSKTRPQCRLQDNASGDIPNTKQSFVDLVNENSCHK